MNGFFEVGHGAALVWCWAKHNRWAKKCPHSAGNGVEQQVFGAGDRIRTCGAWVEARSLTNLATLANWRRAPPPAWSSLLGPGSSSGLTADARRAVLCCRWPVLNPAFGQDDVPSRFAYFSTQLATRVSSGFWFSAHQPGHSSASDLNRVGRVRPTVLTHGGVEPRHGYWLERLPWPMPTQRRTYRVASRPELARFKSDEDATHVRALGVGCSEAPNGGESAPTFILA